MPSPADLCTWPRNPLQRESKRRPVVVLSPAYPGRSTVKSFRPARISPPEFFPCVW